MKIADRCICCDGRRLRKSPAVLMPFVAKRVFDWEPVEIAPDWGMQTLSSGMAYPLCNSMQCADCGALFLDMRFDDAEMGRLYLGYRDAEYVAVRERFEPGYSARNALLGERATYLPLVEEMLSPHLTWPLHVLDWGGDTGLNTPFLEKADSVSVYDISGLDMAGHVTAVGRENLSDAPFNLVVCSNVLEHVPSPAGLLEEIVGIMRPGTLLYLEVPLESFVADRIGADDLASGKKHWHEHINFFNETALRALIARCGLKLVHFEVLETAIYERLGRQFCLLCTRA